jgi:hypothetical protein
MRDPTPNHDHRTGARAHAFGDGLVTLSPRDAAGITSLDGIGDEIAADGHARVKLSLGWCKALVSLAGLEGASAIEAVDMLSCDTLEQLGPLARAPALRSVWIQQCPRLADLHLLAASDGVPAVVRGRHTGRDAVEAVQKALRDLSPRP